MTPTQRSTPDRGAQPTRTPRHELTETRRFVRGAVPFTLIGLVLYAGLYVASERLIAQYAQRNRFFMVKTARMATTITSSSAALTRRCSTIGT